MTAYWKADQLKRGPSRKQSRTQDRKVYRVVTEGARDPEGCLICRLCGKPGKDEDMDRMHRKSRGSGGKTSLENVAVAHHRCHMNSHLSPRLPGQPS